MALGRTLYLRDFSVCKRTGAPQLAVGIPPSHQLRLQDIVQVDYPGELAVGVDGRQLRD